MRVSTHGPQCVPCVFVCICVISNQSTGKKRSHVLDLSKLIPYCIKHAQDPYGTKVPRLDMCRSIVSLNKKYYLSHDPPLSNVFIK